MILTTPSNALSKSGDIILGTDNHEIETITSVFTTALSGSSFSIRPKTVGDIVSNLSTSIQVLERAQDVKGLMKAKLQDDSQTMSVSDEERYIYNEQWQKYLWTPK